MADQGRETTQGEKPQRKWQAIAREIEQEQDLKKISELTAELNQAMLEEETLKVLQRLGRIHPAA